MFIELIFSSLVNFYSWFYIFKAHKTTSNELFILNLVPFLREQGPYVLKLNQFKMIYSVLSVFSAN